MLPWFNALLETTLLPLASTCFGRLRTDDFDRPLRADDLRVHDAFVVRYACDGPSTAQRALIAHEDQSIISFTIGLNACNEYAGGGTRFADAAGDAAIVHTERGHATVFAGGCLTHAGEPITAGRRYIAVVFLYVDGFVWAPHDP